jgi:hypothetical protein
MDVQYQLMDKVVIFDDVQIFLTLGVVFLALTLFITLRNGD